MPRFARSAAFAVALMSLPPSAFAGGVRVLSDHRDPARTLFPGDPPRIEARVKVDAPPLKRGP